MIRWWCYVFQCFRFFYVRFLDRGFETVLRWSLSLRFIGKGWSFFWFAGLVFYLLSDSSNPKGAKLFMRFIFISMTVATVLFFSFNNPIISRTWDRIISILRTYSRNWELFWAWLFTFMHFGYFRDWNLYFFVNFWFLNTYCFFFFWWI